METKSALSSLHELCASSQVLEVDITLNHAPPKYFQSFGQVGDEVVGPTVLGGSVVGEGVGNVSAII